jgi:hypothetical protein
MMLDGMLSSPEFRQELHASLINAEAVVRRVFGQWQEKFRSLKDGSFRPRADEPRSPRRAVGRSERQLAPWRFPRKSRGPERRDR